MKPASGLFLAVTIMFAATACRNPADGGTEGQAQSSQPVENATSRPAAPVVATTPIAAAGPRDCVRFLESLNEFLARIPDDQLVTALGPFLRGQQSTKIAAGLVPQDVRKLLTRKVGTIESKGNRFVLRPPVESAAPAAAPAVMPGSTGTPVAPRESPILKQPLFVYFADGLFKVDLRETARYRAPDVPVVDPRNVALSMNEALDGLPEGKHLIATFHFQGDLAVKCELLPDSAPETVATFVSLARGLRNVVTAWPEPLAEAADASGSTVLQIEAEKNRRTEPEWQRIPWYDGTEMHRTMHGYVLGAGRGRDPGFRIPDEFDVTVRHDRPGLLTTLPDFPENGMGAFGFTSVALPDHDDTGTIFGRCNPDEVLRLFSAAGDARRSKRPLKLADISISRTM